MKICGTVSPPGARDHFIAPGRIEIDADLLDGRNSARLQQGLGPLAERAHARAVHGHTFHDRSSQISYAEEAGLAPPGNSAGQPRTPRPKPRLRSSAALRPALVPVAHTSSTGLSFFSSTRRSPISRAGRLRAFGSDPLAKSSAFAQVHDLRAARVDQLRRLKRGQRRTAGASAYQRPDQHRAADEGDGDEHDVVDEELHGGAGGPFRDWQRAR